MYLWTCYLCYRCRRWQVQQPSGAGFPPAWNLTKTTITRWPPTTTTWTSATATRTRRSGLTMTTTCSGGATVRASAGAGRRWFRPSIGPRKKEGKCSRSQSTSWRRSRTLRAASGGLFSSTTPWKGYSGKPERRKCRSSNPLGEYEYIFSEFYILDFCGIAQIVLRTPRHIGPSHMLPEGCDDSWGLWWFIQRFIIKLLQRRKKSLSEKESRSILQLAKTVLRPVSLLEHYFLISCSSTCPIRSSYYWD